MSISDDVVNIPILTVDQSVPDRVGPIGRLVEAKDVIVEKFETIGGGYARVKVQQRGSFESLPTECRDIEDGDVVDVPWDSPRMLKALDGHIVSVAKSIPRVSRGEDAQGNPNPFVAYPDTRVVTNTLDAEVFHTSNATLQVPDNAWINGVTCSVWIETTVLNGVQKTAAMIEFKQDNGATIVGPKVLYDPLVDVDEKVVITKCCIDGEAERFFVVVNTNDGPDNEPTLRIIAYDTNGVELDRASISQNA